MIIGQPKFFVFMCDGCGKEGTGSTSPGGDTHLPDGWHAEEKKPDPSLNPFRIPVSAVSGKPEQEAFFNGNHYCDNCYVIKDVIE